MRWVGFGAIVGGLLAASRARHERRTARLSEVYRRETQQSPQPDAQPDAPLVNNASAPPLPLPEASRAGLDAESGDEDDEGELMTVKVPQGAVSGQQMGVQVPSGKVVAITVPENAVVGKSLRLRYNSKDQTVMFLSGCEEPLGDVV